MCDRGFPRPRAAQVAALVWLSSSVVASVWDSARMSLELVSNSVEETILLFIAADFAYEKNGVDRYAGNDGSEEDDIS